MDWVRYDSGGDVAKRTILLAGRDNGKLAMLTSFLEDGYRLLMARDERTVIKTIEAHSIHLIIIGLSGGDEICVRLKSSIHYSHIPVILLVAEDMPASRIRCLESGADAYMDVPLSREHLRAQVKNLLLNRARVKDYFAHSIYAHMSTISSSQENESFLNKLNELISDNLPNTDLGVDLLARRMNMSRPTLYRKIKCISDLTPNELINVARLNRAAALISTADHKICQVVKMVGFSSRSNFGKAFLKQFRLTPTAYQQLKKKTA